jgi:adenylylsulfate kinase
MTKRILIMGLPGAGKTTLAKKLLSVLSPDCDWYNADIVREQYNDWDFSREGRIRQATRMRELADASEKSFVIADFVCPLYEMRDIYSADFIVWVDTIEYSRFADTNQTFIPPAKYDIKVISQDAEHWANVISTHLLNLS